jgi:hypothetical protein
MFDPYRIPGSRSLHEQRAAHWSLLIGETYSSAVHAEVRRRPHRGMLPDVDFSQAIPDPSRPSLVRRIMRMIRPRPEIRIVHDARSGTSGPVPAGSHAAPAAAGGSADGPGDSQPSVLDGMRFKDFVRSRAA